MRIGFVLLGALLLFFGGFTTPTQAQGLDNWTASFYNNTTFSGGATAVVNYTNGLNFLWMDVPTDNNNAPIAGINADNFSARFTTSPYFEAGTYLFQLEMNDGARFLIDGQEIFASFAPVPDNQMLTVDIDVPMTEGKHTLTIEFVDYTGPAVIAFTALGGAITPSGDSGDSRFCFPAGSAPVAMYANNGGFDIYRIDGQAGTLVIRQTAEELAALPARPEQNLEIASTDDGSIRVFRLTSGEYQVNVNSWMDGKTHTCIFTNASGANARRSTTP